MIFLAENELTSEIIWKESNIQMAIVNLLFEISFILLIIIDINCSFIYLQKVLIKKTNEYKKKNNH